ncbi:hypothetical protein BGZ65_005084, partial [Modicella reniformis]
YQAKRNKRKTFYGLENNTIDFQSETSTRNPQVSHLFPMSNPTLSKSTPAFSSYLSPALSRSSYILQPSGFCTCSNTNTRVSCLLHKALPKLPTEERFEGNRTKEGTWKSTRLSAISTAPLKSFLLSTKKSRPHTVNESFSSTAEHIPRIPNEHVLSAATFHEDASEFSERLPSPIVQRAVERHAGRNLSLLANDSLRGNRNLGILRRDHETKNHSVHNIGRKSPLLRSRHPLYRHSLSISSPCLPNGCDQAPSKTLYSCRSGSRSRSTVASNVQAQVSVVNVRAEIIPPATALPTHQASQEYTSGMGSNLDSRQHLGFNFARSNATSWVQETTDSMAPIPLEREKIPFFEPFQAEAQYPSYVSFHFDLSHLETQETDSSVITWAQGDTNKDGEDS